MKHFSPLPILFLLAISCTEQNKTHPISFAPKVTEVKGYVVPKDSISEPIIIPAGKPRSVVIGNLTVIPGNSNEKIAGNPKAVLTGIPLVTTIGVDGFAMPKIVTAIDSSFIAKRPEIVTAKDPNIKNPNPQNFSSFNKLQGLKNGKINCLLEDSHGNIWFGTWGGGVTRYDGKNFTNFDKESGLSSNDVRCMLEDRFGNIWFGTNLGGVTKFNGNRFTHYTTKEGLSDNIVFSMIEDKKGNIWIGTYKGGVTKYTPSTVTDGGQFTHLTEKEGLPNNNVTSIMEDRRGNIWFGTNRGGASKFDGKRFTTFTTKEGLPNNDIRCMLEDKKGNVWLGTYGGGIVKYDGKSFINFTTNDGISYNHINCIIEDNKENLWFGTFGGGITKYDGKHFVNFNEDDGLPNNVIKSILMDKKGNLWCGTDGGGVSKFNGQLFTHLTEKEGLPKNDIRSILKDKYGNLWFGSNGGGISKYDGKAFVHFPVKDGLAYVKTMYEDKSGNIWFGTYLEGVAKYDGKKFTYYSDKEGLANNIVISIIEDKKGDLWFGTFGGGISRYTPALIGESGNGYFTNFTKKEGLSGNNILSILEDKDGNLWIGSNEDGLTKYDGKNFTHFTEKEGLISNSVSNIHQDRNGCIWLTTNMGVSKLSKGFFTNFTVTEGLSSNKVSSVFEDKIGNLWFGTDIGLNKLKSTNTKKLNPSPSPKVNFKNYTYEDGFLGIGCNGKSICEGEIGTLWIGSNDRVTVYHSEGDIIDTIAPNIQITSIELFNENIDWANLLTSTTEVYKSKTKSDSINRNAKMYDTTLILGNGVSISDVLFKSLSKWYQLPEKLSLSYNNNYLTFNFIGITQKQSKKVKYQYKLEGIDDYWSAITDRTEAPYGNLPHGTYSFKVKAMNSEGYWSNEFSYNFTIRPPWWKTWWFRTIVGLLVIASIWYYIKSREKKLIAEKETLEKTVVERTKEVVEEKKIVEEQKHIIEEKHKEITDSINYAERIQRSFLATKELLDENLSSPWGGAEGRGGNSSSLGRLGGASYFVLFKPKDVVSGDFYWASKVVSSSGVENFALVTADSTGHGVPGAIMSLLNITSLEGAVKDGFTEPSEILNATRKTIIERLKKDGSAEGGKDGMDASLICFDFANKKLIISAANNPVWIVRRASHSLEEEREGEAEVIEIKPDKMPVGKHDKDQTPFTQQTIDLQTGDVIYAITDGFPDQFGGEKGKKFMSKNLRELLAANSHLPMHEQKQLLEKTFVDWVGNLEQVDDVTIIGVKV